MKNPSLNLARRWALMFCLLFSHHHGVAQYVELTAEIEIDTWDFWFFSDKINGYPLEDSPPSVFRKGFPVRLVVGTNTWMMQGDFSKNAKMTRWFNATNVIEHSLITKETPETTTKRLSQISRFAITSPRVGYQYTHITESL